MNIIDQALSSLNIRFNQFKKMKNLVSYIALESLKKWRTAN